MIGDLITVIIPSYNPTENLIKTVTDLRANGFYDIVIVADGEENKQYFETCKNSDCTVIFRKVNRGKGAALKAGFKYCLENRKEKRGVVTVDGEGNHSIEDITACCNALINEKTPKVILGVRDFAQCHVPKKTRVGNTFSSFVFWTACKLSFSDTQSSLRAISAEYLGQCLKIQSNGFEFEIDMLLQMQKLGMEYKEVKIKTIKDENHRPLHFHPVRDSFRIYMLIFKFAASSLLCTGVDLLAFYLLTKFLTPFLMFASITLCTFVARAISSFLNYSINKKAVFKDQKIPKYTLLRFYSIAIPQACLSAIFVQFLTSLFSADYAIIKTLLKMIVDTSLFFLSFQLQRKWVFKNKK